MSPTTSGSPIPTAGRSLRILYADDMRQLRELMGQILEDEGHSIETVEDGAQALERLAGPEAAFDLLITDHHMPVMNGLELVRQLRLRPFQGRIIVFSSELSPAVHQQYRQLAVDLILPKPIFPLTFVRVLQELFVPGSAGNNLHRGASRSPLDAA